MPVSNKMGALALGGAGILGCCLPMQAAASGSSLISGTFTTKSATADQAAICPSGTGYPAEFTYAGQSGGPASATAGQPRIEQYRQGLLIATYTNFANAPGCVERGDGTDYVNPAPAAASGCGPFTRVGAWRLWAPGDTFLVYPAIYSGEINQPWFGPEYDNGTDYNNNVFHTPDNVLVQGVVQNNTRPVILLQGNASNNTLGQAPVYFAASSGLTIDNLNVVAGQGARAGKAAVYIDGAANLTLTNMRISGFARAGQNGLFATSNASGTLTLSGLELDHNGGPNGPAHNAYIGASAVDPNFTVSMTNSWSHDAYYGHLFKTRAQNGVFTANLFQGGLPNAPHTQAENYLLDMPNGGRLTVRNNVFIKNASGPNSNAMSLTFLLEGATDARPQSVDVENNTFVTFAKTYNGYSPNYPMAFLYPSVRPDSPVFPANITTRIIKNAFVGYCPAGDGGTHDYRGDISVVEGFSELTHIFALRKKLQADDAALASIYTAYTPEIGTRAHSGQPTIQTPRQQSTIGAQD